MQDTEPKINPWITMWTQPQKTIRAVIGIDPKMGFMFLASIWFLQYFFLFEAHFAIEFPIHWALSIVIAVILSPVIGSIYFYIMGYLLHVVGMWLKGKASFLHTRCAFAWSRMPLIIDLIMWFVISFFISQMIFAKNGYGRAFLFVNIIAFATSIWSFILLIGAIKEIQKFSTFKAILNVVLVYLILTLIMIIIIYLLHLIKLI
jgi:hypothetical protein